MISMLQFDQSTLANMTAALEYVCRKLPPDRDNPAIRKHIAAEIVAACQKGQTSHEELASVGLKIVNSYLFPPGRSSAWSVSVFPTSKERLPRRRKSNRP